MALEEELIGTDPLKLRINRSVCATREIKRHPGKGSDLKARAFGLTQDRSYSGRGSYFGWVALGGAKASARVTSLSWARN